MKRVLVIALIILILVGVSILYFVKKADDFGECRVDSDCVATSCCHSNSCVAKEFAPDCSGIFCTMECKPETMDCGQGSCGCVKGKCEVNWE